MLQNIFVRLDFIIQLESDSWTGQNEFGGPTNVIGSFKWSPSRAVIWWFVHESARNANAPDHKEGKKATKQHMYRYTLSSHASHAISLRIGLHRLWHRKLKSNRSTGLRCCEECRKDKYCVKQSAIRPKAPTNNANHNNNIIIINDITIPHSPQRVFCFVWPYCVNTLLYQRPNTAAATEYVYERKIP